jgi:cytochrome c-type biogenesis protein
MVAFGSGYAIASASCTAGILLAVVTQALASADFTGVLLVFAAYAAGSATLLLSLAVFAAFSSGLISHYLRRLSRHMHRITGAILAVSGAYLLLYWLPQLVGGQPGTNLLTGVVGAVSLWISGHQLAIAITTIGLVTAVAVLGLSAHSAPARPARRHKAPQTVEDYCAAVDQQADASAPHDAGEPGYLTPGTSRVPNTQEKKTHD